MPSVWNQEHSRQFWSTRQWLEIGHDENTQSRKQQYNSDEQNRQQKDLSDKALFLQANSSKHASENSEQHIPSNETANLEFWIAHGSYNYCSDCKTILPLRLLPRFPNRPLLKRSKNCACKLGRYLIPTTEAIANVLHGLSIAEICALRPLTIHNGDYVRAENGYRKKNGITQLSWSTLSVLDKIEAISDNTSRNKCLQAYNFLMNEPRSSYREFVEKRDQLSGSQNKFNLYNSTESRHVECCLWPHLYPTREWCETGIEGQSSRLSTKISFLTKVFSTILDYGTNYELLQFHYDLWLFKTVSGALTSGRFRGCSPARSLETKPFSVEYWKWQHRFLLDAVSQYGPPSVFVTISPYEWSFPAPPWLSSLRLLTGKGPTQLASFETKHITHILEQIIRGYLCGSNDKKWSNHIFNYNNIATYSNIQTYFYRFEFQSRGTVHVHLLVWLKDIKHIRLKLLRADIPWADPHLAYEVTKLQKSDKGAISHKDGPTEVLSINDTQVLRLHHPADAFALNLRGYISSLVPSLKCRMDVQTSDGHGMLLRYVTSYISKWEDSFQSDSLYSVHVGPYQAAYKHILCMKPLEPEMWLALSSTKMSWTPCRRKKFRFSSVDNLSSNPTYMKYLRRDPMHSDLSFLQWLRTFDETKGRQYKNGSTLVGVKVVSPLKDFFFFQHLVLNYPHSSLEELFHRDHDKLPAPIKHFSAAFTLANDFWSHPDKVQTYFMQQGHKSWFIETVVAHISSLSDYFHLYQRRVIGSTNITFDLSLPEEAVNDPIQNRFVKVVKMCLAKRDSYYEEIAAQDDNCDSDCDDDVDEHDDMHEEEIQARHNDNSADTIDWKKVLLLTGKPGTGKTHCVKRAIYQAIEEDRSVMIATPTGFLATTYSAAFPHDVDTDTVHSAFKYPVISTDPAQINWDLMMYDLIVVDEVSMVSKDIMQHVLSTINQLSLRPLVIMCGDQYQQQPIATIDEQTRQVPSILQEKNFYKVVNHFHLTKQHRCDDPRLLAILNHLRHYRPSAKLLEEIHDGRILCPSAFPSDTDIQRALHDKPNATFITVSRKAANRVNEIAINFLFKDQTPLMHAQCDCELPPIPLYNDLPVMITQNRDKSNGVVNGQRAIIKLVQNKTVFLQLPNGSLVSTHLVTCKKPDGSLKTSYPFVPAYAVTICKSQGQTLEQVIIWMDTMHVPAGAAYVALSRVRKIQDLFFLTQTCREQYKPVSQTDS